MLLSSVNLDVGELVYEADPGELNDLVVDVDAGEMVVRDSGASIKPATGVGFTAVNANEVRIDLASVSSIRVSLGDMADRGELTAAVSLRATMTGGAGDDTLLGGAGLNTLGGGGGDDTLIGGDGGNNLTGGDGDDSITGGLGADRLTHIRDADMVIDDTTIVTAGAETDTFSGVETLSLRGGASDNHIDLSAVTFASDVERTSIDGRGGDDVLIGGAALDVLIGGEGNDTLDGGPGNQDTVQVSRDVDIALTDTQVLIGAAEVDIFTNIEGALLTGGAADNQLDASAATVLSTVTLRGRGGNDTLIADSGSSRKRLVGDDGDDRYVFTQGWTNSSTSVDQVNDTQGVNTLDFSALGRDLSFDLGDGSVRDGTNVLRFNQADISAILAGSGNDVLVGADASQTWSLTTTNGGLVDGVAFSDIESLAGGDADDTFLFDDGASLAGGIDGDLGTDTIDWSAFTTPPTVNVSGAGSVDGSAGDASNLGTGFDNMENLIEPVPPTTTLEGIVFDDLDNDGEPDSGEPGLAGVEIRLVGTDDLGQVDRTVTTTADGSYFLRDVRPGTYSLIEVSEPAGLLDGNETAGSLGGSVDNSQDGNTISDINVEAGDPTGQGYNFADIRPSGAQGLVWEDFNDNGEVDFGEKAIVGVTVTLTGSDDRGNAVDRQVTTDQDGVYVFDRLRPGTYTIEQTQPNGFDDGADALGSVNGMTVGDASVNDTFSGVVLDRPGSIAENYNFGERPVDGEPVEAGQAATIGFWQNRNGQRLIKGLNGSADSTLLANWLAATLPNMYGANAGENDLTGRSNAEVARFYRDVFHANKGGKKTPGPAKLDAQVLAVSLATYLTNETNAQLKWDPDSSTGYEFTDVDGDGVYDPGDGDTAVQDETLKSAVEAYGFLVTEYGLGVSTVNVGDAGEAFGVADDTELSVLDLLKATDERTRNGTLYDEDVDGEISSGEAALRKLANEIYAAINEVERL